MSNMPARLKVAIIGSGGAGMTAAWLLDGQHSVTLFEKSEVLGGHARSARVERDGHTHFADDGFSWFCDVLYPRFTRLLTATQVPVREVDLALSFTHRRLGHTVVLPPGPLQALGLLRSPSLLRDLLTLERSFRLAAPLVNEQLADESLGAFITRHRLPEAFCRDMLVPMLAGSWGNPYGRTLDFSAYTLFKYFVKSRPSFLGRFPWRVIDGGAASYINAVAATLRSCTLRPSTGAQELQRGPDGWTLRDDDGNPHHFDRVIVATGARDALRLLADTPAQRSVREVLGRFEYYTTQVAIHSDPSLLPPNRSDWRAANISTDGQSAELSVWVGADTNSDVFTSYLRDRQPKHCHRVSTFHLPMLTPEHYHQQRRLSELQGDDGLWFAGDWTQDIGSHEDAVSSAFDACAALDASLPRLQVLEPTAARDSAPGLAS